MMTQLIKDYKVKGFNVVIRRLSTIWESWYTVYVGKDKFLKTLSKEQIENNILCHGGVTWDGIYPSKAPKSSLTGKDVIGWDYAHAGDEATTESMVISDVEEAITGIIALKKCGDLA